MATGEPAAVAPHHSSLRRFSKDHAVSEDIQHRFMIAVENDEKAAKTRVQDWLVRTIVPFLHPQAPHSPPLALGLLLLPNVLVLYCTEKDVMLFAAHPNLPPLSRLPLSPSSPLLSECGRLSRWDPSTYVRMHTDVHCTAHSPCTTPCKAHKICYEWP